MDDPFPKTNRMYDRRGRNEYDGNKPHDKHHLPNTVGDSMVAGRRRAI